MSDMLTRVTLDLTLTDLGRTVGALTSTADAYREAARAVLGRLPSGTGERTNRYWLQRAVETEALRDRIRDAWARGPMVQDDGPTPADEAEHAALIRQAIAPPVRHFTAAEAEEHNREFNTPPELRRPLSLDDVLREYDGSTQI